MFFSEKAICWFFLAALQRDPIFGIYRIEFILKQTVAQIPKYWVTRNGVIHIAWKKIT